MCCVSVCVCVRERERERSVDLCCLHTSNSNNNTIAIIQHYPNFALSLSLSLTRTMVIPSSRSATIPKEISCDLSSTAIILHHRPAMTLGWGLSTYLPPQQVSIVQHRRIPYRHFRVKAVRRLVATKQQPTGH